jgi:hypothetical protein
MEAVEADQGVERREGESQGASFQMVFCLHLEAVMIIGYLVIGG